MPDFSVESTQIANAVVIKVAGQLRLLCEPLEIALRKAIAHRPGILVFDLSQLTFTSTLGMGCLVNAHRGLKMHGGKVRLAGTQPQILEVLQRARMTELFPNFPTVDEAVNAP